MLVEITNISRQVFSVGMVTVVKEKPGRLIELRFRDQQAFMVDVTDSRYPHRRYGPDQEYLSVREGNFGQVKLLSSYQHWLNLQHWDRYEEDNGVICAVTRRFDPDLKRARLWAGFSQENILPHILRMAHFDRVFGIYDVPMSNKPQALAVDFDHAMAELGERSFFRGKILYPELEEEEEFWGAD